MSYSQNFFLGISVLHALCRVTTIHWLQSLVSYPQQCIWSSPFLHATVTQHISVLLNSQNTPSYEPTRPLQDTNLDTNLDTVGGTIGMPAEKPTGKYSYP
jgi:hypothetical protein